MTTLLLDSACFERGCACYDYRTADAPPVEVAERQLVQLLVKDQYGAPVLHPHNDTAKLFAEIAKTKTLTIQAVKHIMALGYAIEYVYGEIKI